MSAGPKVGGLPYRPEIDGLRAVAVLSVILFHAGFERFGGGYLGVDLFFVISGFLITSIILAADEQGTFSLVSFYLRRIRRIVPALLLTMLATIPFAIAWLMPDQLTDYGRSLVATTAMANNVMLWLSTGYWSMQNEFRPLTHSWSLGVEEQFYLLFPPLMALLLRRGHRRWLVPVLLAAGVASMALAEVLPDYDFEATFLLLPTRIWELAIGALAGLAHRSGWLEAGRLGPWLAAIGAVAAIVPVLVFNGDDSAPSLPTLVPVAGCALLLLYGRTGEGVGRVLALRPVVAVGLISYSLYLFHQPVFAFARVLSFTEPSPWFLASFVPAILACSALSWRYVERPFRDASRVGNRALLALCAVGAIVAVTVGLVLNGTHGFASRWAALGGYGMDGRPDRNQTYVDAPFRYIGARLDPAARKHNVLFVGNSFARDVINMAKENAVLTDHQIAYIVTNDCTAEVVRSSLAYAGSVDTVILATGLPPEDLRCYGDGAARLAAAGIGHVRIIGPKQFGYSMAALLQLPPEQRYHARFDADPYAVNASRQAARQLPAGVYVDFLSLLDRGDGRLPGYTPDHKLVSMDTRHLTPAGARWVGGRLYALPAFAHLRPDSSRNAKPPSIRPPDR